MSDYKIQGEVTLDTSKADSAFARVESSAGKMAQGVEQSANKTSKAVSGIGDGADASAKKLEAGQSRMIAQMKRLSLEMEAGGKNTSKYFELLGKQRGYSSDAFAPHIAKLKEVEARQNAATESLSGLSNTMKLVGQGFAAIGVGAFIRGFATLADASTGVASRLSLVTSSTAELAEVQNKLFLSAQASRVGFVDLAGTYAQIARSTKELGVSQTSLLGVIDTISQSVTISGGSASSANAALTQLSQGFASGTIRGEELNSVLEQTPRLAQAIAEGLGVGIGQLREMGKAGELTAEAVLGALQNSANSVEQEFNKMAVTIEGATTRASNSVLKLVGIVDNLAGASGAAAIGISKISGAIDFLSSDLEKLGSQGPLREASEEVIGLDNAVKRMKARMEDGVIGREFQGQLDRLIARLAIAKRNFNELYDASKGLGGTSSANYGNEGAREASRQKDIERQSALLSDLNAFRRKQSGVSESYIKDMKEIIRLNKAGVLVGDEYTKAIKSQQDALLKKTEATGRALKADQSAFDEFSTQRGIAKEWADALGDFSRMAADAEASSLGLSNAQKRLVEYLGSNAYSQASESMRELVLQQAYVVIAAEQNAEALKDQQAAYEAITKAENARINALQSSASTVQSQVQSLMEEERAAALAAAMNITLAQAVQEVAIARLQEQQANLMTQGDRDADVLAIQAEIDARRELKSVIGQQEQRKAIEDSAKDAQKEWEKTSASIEGALTDALMRGFEGGKGFGENFADSLVNTFKTYVARELATSLAKALASGFSNNGQGFNLGSLLGGGGGGSSWIDLAQQAYSAYSGGATAAATSYGSSYAAGTVSQSVGYAVPASTTAASSGVASSTMSAGGYTGYGYLGYAALIAAAVMVAENLYEKGYTRAALGVGEKERFEYGTGNFTSGGRNEGSSRIYQDSAENFNRKLLGAIGLSDKWADILSGTVRMAALFGRKLKGYGFEASIEGGDTSVRGYEYYKGGVFRSNKTTYSEVNDADSMALKGQIESWTEGTRNMARALGYSEEAIDSYTGKVRINFKGVKSNAEAAERYQEAMEKLQFEMLRAASGTKLTKDAFKSMMEDIQASIESAGISAGGIGDLLAQGAIGKMDSSQVGEALSESIIGGIYNTIAQNAMAPVAEAFMNSIITPIFTAIMAGVPISQAVSQAAIENVVRSAQQAAAALNAVFSDPAFRDAIGQIQGAISSVSGIVTRPAASVVPYGSSRNNAASSAASERYNLETKLLTLLGETDKLRARELATISASNRSLQTRIWMLEDAKDALTTSMSALESAISAEQEIVQERLSAAQESESLLNGIFENIRDNIKEMRGEIDGGSAMLATEAANYIQSLISSGSTPDADEVNGAISALRNNYESSVFASAADRDRAAFSVINQLTALEGVVGSQLSDAEYQVSLAEDQLQALDDQLELSQSQVNALQGIDDSVMSVADAIAALTAAMSGYSTAFGVSMPASVYSTDAAPVQSVDSINFDESSTVYTSGFVRKSGETDELLRQLLTEMKLSRSESIATAVNTNRVALLLKQVTKNGTAMTVETDGTTIEVAA